MSSPLLHDPLLLAQNVPPKATAPAVAQDSGPAPSGAAPSGSSGLVSMLPMLLMLGIMLPFLLMGQRGRKKEAQARAALKKGDRVTTTSGLIGELVEIDERIAKVKVAAGVTVQFVANTVSPYVEPASAPAKELKPAKALPDKK